MLNWLGGQKAGEAGGGAGKIKNNETSTTRPLTRQDPDDTGLFEAPETPAPVFAVRAFKHALFGTPQTIQAKPRRNSTNDHHRPSRIEVRATRPATSHQRSSSDAPIIPRLEAVQDAELPASPTKGILMTPGTAATRRKTVSFGEEVVDNEGKRPSKSGLPDDYPGKFPSPWTKSSKEQDYDSEDQNTKGKTRNKLTEAFEQVREESAKRKSKLIKHPTKAKDDTDLTMDMAEPLSDSGKYWKNEYDIYRDRTTREVKKLVIKQKAAKAFARDKDIQCSELAEELRLERQKVDRLEKRTAELEAQLKEMQERLHASERHEKSSRRRSHDRSSRRPRSQDGRGHAASVASSRGLINYERASAPVLSSPPRDEVRALPAPPSQIRQNQETETETQEARTTQPVPRLRQRGTQPQLRSDPWAPSSSSVAIRPEPTTGRTVTSGTEATPLQSLSANGLPDTSQAPVSKAIQPPAVMKLSPPRQDSALPSPDIPASQQQPQSKTQYLPPDLHARKSYPRSELSSMVPDSSPFQPDADGLDSLPPRASLPTPAAGLPSRAPTAVAKENLSPLSSTLKSGALGKGEEILRPSSAWTAMKTATPPGRTLIGKDGQEVGAERLAAARARLLARGRNVSDCVFHCH